jgi:hypothetical protein
MRTVEEIQAMAAELSKEVPNRDPNRPGRTPDDDCTESALSALEWVLKRREDIF